MSQNSELSVAIIGAGPVGLAAAAHLVERGIGPVVFEKGASVGAALLDWGHVRVFSPWKYNVDEAARRLLEAHDWVAPDPEALPNGKELVAQYLVPLAAVPSIRIGLKLGVTVTAITKKGLSKIASVACSTIVTTDLTSPESRPSFYYADSGPGRMRFSFGRSAGFPWAARSQTVSGLMQESPSRAAISSSRWSAETKCPTGDGS